MTKSPHKLMLRKETLRALNTIDLGRVVGGADGGTAPLAITPTEKLECPRQQEIVVPAK
jgi:hypothetical protein